MVRCYCGTVVLWYVVMGRRKVSINILSEFTCISIKMGVWYCRTVIRYNECNLTLDNSNMRASICVRRYACERPHYIIINYWFFIINNLFVVLLRRNSSL